MMHELCNAKEPTLDEFLEMVEVVNREMSSKRIF